MAATSWTTVAEESCTTCLITGGSKSGRVAGPQEQEERVDGVVYSSSGWTGACGEGFSLLCLRR